jgi:hypothetical protein
MVLLVLAFIVPMPSSGQRSFSVRLERGELGLQGQGSYQLVGALTGSDQVYGQWLRLPVAGFLVHPRVLNYSVTLSPQFNQQNASFTSEGTRNRTLGVDMSLGLFPTRRLSFSLQSIRTSGRTAGAFGAESDVRSSSVTLAAFFRHRYFPATLSYQQRGFEDAWSSPFAAGPVLRDQLHRQWRLEVRNKKLTTSLTRNSKDDRRGADHFVANAAQLTHRTDWGKGSALTSSLVFLSRTGFGPIQQRTITERLHLQHTGMVSSDFVLATRSWGRGSEYTSRSRALGAVVMFRPGPSFEAAINGDLQSFSSALGTMGTSRAAVSPNAVLTTYLPLGVRLSARSAMGIERIERVGGNGQWIDVIEERHLVGESWRVSLDHPWVDISSIEVWSEDRTFRLEAEIDYRVFEIGGFVEIQFLPSGRVDENSALLATYRYERTGSERANTLFWNYDMSLVRSALTLRHGRRQRGESVFGDDFGPAGGSDIDMDTWYGVGFSGRTPLGPTRLEVNRRTRVGSGLHSVADELQGQWDLPLRGSVRLGMQGALGRVRSDGTLTGTTSMGAQFGWTLSRTVRLRAGLRAFRWEREGVSDPERFLSGNGVLTWDWGRVSALISYDQARRWNGTARADHHWSMRLVRHF